MKLPMRFRIMHIVSQKDEVSNKEVVQMLKKEYGDEGQYKESIINTHLMSMRAVGIIKNTRVELDEKGDLVQYFTITDYGKKLLRNYLPQNWKASA